MLETPHVTALPILTGHFDEGPGYRAYRQRGVDDWLLVCTAAGAGRFGFAGGELLTRPGSWVLLPPGEPHDYGTARGEAGWNLLWAHFQARPHWQDLMDWPRAAGGPMHLFVDPAVDGRRIEALLAQAHAASTGGEARHDLVAMNHLEAVLIALDAHNPARAAPATDRRMLRVAEHIETHLADRLDLAALAGVAGLSPSRLSHLFAAEFGRSVQTHVEATRMQRAAALLRRTSFSIKQISGMVGFENPFYFSLRFKAWSSLSPSAFRRRGLPDGGG